MANMRIALLLCWLLPLSAQASEDLWDLLARGGHAVFIRHTITDPGVGDPPGMRLDDCSTQRNLSDEGRAHARRIGQELRKRGIPVARVLSSPWCRCLETARLAFGKAEIAQPLSNLFGRPKNRERQVNGMRTLLDHIPKKSNLVLVTHGSTILALTGVSPATGEMVIVSPDGKLVGRLSSE